MHRDLQDCRLHEATDQRRQRGFEERRGRQIVHLHQTKKAALAEFKRIFAKRFPIWCSNITADVAVPRSGSCRSVPNGRTSSRAGSRAVQGGISSGDSGSPPSGPARRDEHRQADLHRAVRRQADVVTVPHRQHDPARHLRPPPRDRGDEARRRLELSSCAPLHGRGHRAGSDRCRARRRGRRRAKFGFDHWFTSTTGFFREFYVTGSDATVIGLTVFGLGSSSGSWARPSACVASFGPPTPSPRPGADAGAGRRGLAPTGPDGRGHDRRRRGSTLAGASSRSADRR